MDGARAYGWTENTDCVEAGSERQAARRGDLARRGLQTDDPTERGGDADGTTLVAAKGDVDLTGGDRGAGARRRSTRHVLGIVGVQRPTIVADTTACSKAATQPVHHVLADDGAARLEHARDHGGVEIGNEPLECERAKAHGHTGHCDVILEADGLAGQRSVGGTFDVALPAPGIERVFAGTR